MEFIEVAPKGNHKGSTQKEDVMISTATSKGKKEGCYVSITKNAFTKIIGYNSTERVFVRFLKTRTYNDRLYMSFSLEESSGGRLIKKRGHSLVFSCKVTGTELDPFLGEHKLIWDANERMFYILKNK